MALKLDELRGLVGKKIQIDEYQAKMGEDQDVITISLEVKYYNPALDLVSFIEKGYDWVLDADISSGEMANGGYLIFIEAERKPSFPKHLLKMLSDLEGVTTNKLEDYRFLYYKGHKYEPVSLETMEQDIPLTVEAYKEIHGEPDKDEEMDGEEDIQDTEAAAKADAEEEQAQAMMESMRRSAGVPHKKVTITDTELKNFINLSKR